MDEASQLSDLIGDIYDASLDAGLWPSVVEEIARFVPGALVNLFSQGVTRNTAKAFYTFGIDQENLNLYLQKYIHLDPMLPATLFFEVGRILTVEDIIPQSEFTQSRFYQEYMKPQGLLSSSMASILEKSANSVAAIAVVRGERHGPVDDASLRRMSLIVPHVRRSVIIGRIIDLHKVEAAALADTLDGVAAGMFLVDADARIVHANASGLGMIDGGAALRTTGGKLTLNDPGADRMLRESLAAAATGDLAIGAKGIAVPIDAGRDARHVAHILPLTTGTRRKAGVEYSAVAAVFVCKAELDLPHPVEAMANAYKLTPAEIRVLMTIVQIGGVPEVAPVLGVSETTVKTHLQHIFGKTGTTRQADLVKLVAGYMSPLSR